MLDLWGWLVDAKAEKGVGRGRRDGAGVKVNLKMKICQNLQKNAPLESGRKVDVGCTCLGRGLEMLPLALSPRMGSLS